MIQANNDILRKFRGAAMVRETLRYEIVAGHLLPGTVLPSHVELAKHFGVSNVTVQQGLSQLASQGFLDVRPRVGTFVAENPPHLNSIAMVFPFDPVSPVEFSLWSKYYQGLTRAAVNVQKELGRRITMFHGIDFHTDSEDRERLLRHIERQQLAGIIFASSPHFLTGTPVLDEPGLPRVELSSATQSRWPAIHFNGQWIGKAVNYLIDRQRRRVAVLFNRFERNGHGWAKEMDTVFAEHEIECPARWRQATEWRDPTATNHCVQLLMHGAADQRPEALLVMDDNLIEGVMAGLMAAGVRVPQDVEVVAHANFPLSSVPALPIRLLGCDLCAVVREAIGLIDRQRQGEDFPVAAALPAIWDDELETKPATVPFAAMAESSR